MPTSSSFLCYNQHGTNSHFIEVHNEEGEEHNAHESHSKQNEEDVGLEAHNPRSYPTSHERIIEDEECWTHSGKIFIY